MKKDNPTPLPGETAEPLNLLDKDEAEQLAFIVAPKNYTSEDFERDWAEFQEIKKRKQMS